MYIEYLAIALIKALARVGAY